MLKSAKSGYAIQIVRDCKVRKLEHECYNIIRPNGSILLECQSTPEVHFWMRSTGLFN